MSVSVSVSETIVEDLGEIDVPRAEVLRLLGVRGREPRASVAAMLEEELLRSAALVEPRAALRLGPGGLPGSAALAPGLPLVAVVCTIAIVVLGVAPAWIINAAEAAARTLVR